MGVLLLIPSFGSLLPPHPDTFCTGHGCHGGLCFFYLLMALFTVVLQTPGGMNADTEQRFEIQVSTHLFITSLLSCFGESLLSGDGLTTDTTPTR